MTKRLVGVFLAAVLGLALGQRTLIVYYADDLERAPGTIYVSKGFNTVIQFYDKLDVYALSRQEIVQVQELSPSTLYFTTLNIQGVTGLTAIINGRVLNFTVVVRPGDFNRTYRVEPSRFIQGEEAVEPRSAPPPSPSPTTPPSTTSPSPSPLVEASFALASYDGKKAVASFTVRNLTGEDVYLDIARLGIAQAGKRLNFTVVRSPSRVRLGPQEVQTGTLTFSPVSSSSPVSLEWTVTTAKGRAQTLKATLPLEAKEK